MQRSDGKHLAAIGLGSNLGDRAAYLLRSIERLTALGVPVTRISRIYESEPVDYLDQPAFLNMVLLAEDLRLPPPKDLLSICLKIEKDLGRDRLIPKGPRVIDLDLLIYDDLIFKDRSDDLDLILPHPRMHERGFVLQPLAELIPQELHPVLNVTYSALLERLQLFGKITLYID
jgi:2-amino-4-hydroxy-6-hydroxymethyldihydropteridine diphosphokinase